MRTLAVLALASLTVVAGPAAASRPLVPLIAQRRIAERSPRLAYVPARGAIPYRYRYWELANRALRIWFANRDEPRKTVVFEVRVFHGSCRAGMEKSFQMSGVKTWYSDDGDRRQAWRCVHGTKLTAWTTMGPRVFADVGLARIAASGHRIRQRRREPVEQAGEPHSRGGSPDGARRHTRS